MTALENVLVGGSLREERLGKGSTEGSHRLPRTPQSFKAEGRDLESAHLFRQKTCRDRQGHRGQTRSGAARRASLGTYPSETEKIMEIIGIIRQTRGVSIIWIEHKMEAVFKLCDRIVVLDYGKKIAEGVPKEISHNKAVVEAYLGEPLS